MEADEFVLKARIDTQTLDAWLEVGWVQPSRNVHGTSYSEIDVARAHLINDLNDLGVNDAGVPIILDLVDQLHGVRRQMRVLLSAVNRRGAQDEVE